VSVDLPLSACLAWWLTAWLRGFEVTDHVLDALSDGELGQVVEGLAGASGSAGVAADGDAAGTALVDLLRHARRSGATSAGLALPIEGDLLGLGGPRALNEAALDAGEAVVCGPWAVVPRVTGEVAHWQVLAAAPRQLPDVGEADRALRAAMIDTARLLADLDVARWRPEAADALMNLRHLPVLTAPQGTPRRCVDLAARGLQGWAIAELALADDAGVVDAHQIDARRAAIRPLERAARRALVAAFSPEVWPDH